MMSTTSATGWPPHLPDGQIAEISLRRILFAASLALEGSEWEERSGDASGAIDELLRSGMRGERLNDLVLNATADLRAQLASEA